MRPALEVADIFRRHGAVYRTNHAGSLSRRQHRVMAAIESCRTAALSGHIERCEDCGETRIAYNSCLMGKFRNGEWAQDLAAGLAQERARRRQPGLWLPINST